MKVLFLVSDFNMGGITSALNNLTQELIHRGHEVEILNMPMAEEKPDWMANDINLLELSGKARLWNLTVDTIRKATWYKKPWLLVLGFVKKVLNKYGLWNQIVFGGLDIQESYDYAIAFRQEPTSIWLVSHKVKCKRKISFWHSDPDAEDTSEWDHCVYDMDVIAGVSNDVCDKLRFYHPGINAKTVYNVFNTEQIRKKAEAFDAGYNKSFQIVTVARVDFPQKQLDIIPAVAARLKKTGLDFQWTIVGDGPDMAALQQIVGDQGVSDCVNLAGAQMNPYPYIKQADLFVLTSAWESYGMVVMEALILHVPVVAGDYPALHEILEDGVKGLIVPNSEEGIYQGIFYVMKDKKRYAILKDNCNRYEYSADQAYQQFINLGEELYD